MSKATKRKHVTRQVLDDDVEPEGDQQIVKILSGKGNNLHEVLDVKGQQFLVSMPTKFRKNVWIKRGDFVIVEPIEEGNKVCAEIVHILYSRQIKWLKDERKWPEAFIEKPNEDVEPTSNNNSSWREPCSTSDSDNDDDLFVNSNRPVDITYSDSDSSEEEEEDEEEVKIKYEEEPEVKT